jgi:hypothetical protein
LVLLDRFVLAAEAGSGGTLTLWSIGTDLAGVVPLTLSVR